MTHRIRFSASFGFGLCLLLAAGCERTHLWPAYGQDTRHALRQQVIDPKAGERAKSTEGLDPEEASTVLDTYRKSLSPTKDTQGVTRAPVLVLPQPMPGTAPGQAGYGP